MKRRSPDKMVLLSIVAASTLLVALPVLLTAQADSGVTNVSITSSGFSPSPITVEVGVNNTIIWTNMDNTTHQVSPTQSDPYTTWGSGPLCPGGQYAYTFTVPGPYYYTGGIFDSSVSGLINVVANPSTSTFATSSVSVSSGSCSSASHTGPTSGGSSKSGGGIPEFPFASLAIAAVTAAVAVSYLLARRGLAQRGGPEPRRTS